MVTYSLADLETALETNADFEETGSVSKAKAFITAANRWLIRRPESASNQSSSMQIGKQFVADLLKRAHAYVAANDRSSADNAGVRFLSVADGFR